MHPVQSAHRALGNRRSLSEVWSYADADASHDGHPVAWSRVDQNVRALPGGALLTFVNIAKGANYDIRPSDRNKRTSEAIAGVIEAFRIGAILKHDQWISYDASCQSGRHPNILTAIHDVTPPRAPQPRYRSMALTAVSTRLVADVSPSASRPNCGDRRERLPVPALV